MRVVRPSIDRQSESNKPFAQRRMQVEQLGRPMTCSEHHQTSAPQRDAVENELDRSGRHGGRGDELVQPAAGHLPDEVKRDMDVLARNEARRSRPWQGPLHLRDGLQFGITWPERQEQATRGQAKKFGGHALWL